MKLENNCWVDENANGWHRNLFTEDQAQKLSRTLVNCVNCVDCRGCVNFKVNPNRYIGNKMGSRKSQTTVFWVGANIQVVCGCFTGNLEEFENRVRSTHNGNEHEKEYLQFINIVKTIRKMEGL